MNINTTININPFLRAKIEEISSRYNITMSKIIALIILKIMRTKRIEARMFKSVKYQERNKTIKWRKLHVSYDKEVYEVALDLRKVIKESVSRIIAEGIYQFLDEIVMELSNKKKSADKYLPNYKFKSVQYEKSFFFTIFWDFPIPEFLKNYIL